LIYNYIHNVYTSSPHAGSSRPGSVSETVSERRARDGDHDDVTTPGRRREGKMGYLRWQPRNGDLNMTAQSLENEAEGVD
jgi:hypothetical protein